MLNHDKRVAEVAQIFKRCQKLVVVALMKSYARLVEYIQNARESRAYLRCKAYSLRLAARESACRARKREVAESDVNQKSETRVYFF